MIGLPALGLLIPLIAGLPDPTDLPVGRLIEKDLDVESVDRYLVPSTAGDVVEVVVAQHRLDVELRLIAPDGHEVIVVDSPIGDTGAEVLFAVVDLAGDHQLQVRSEGAGAYTLTIRPPRPASRADRLRATAVRATARAEGLVATQQPDDAAPIDATVDAWRRAIGAWRQAEDRAAEAAAWNQLGIALLHDAPAAKAAFANAIALDPDSPLTRAVAEGFLGSIAFHAGDFTEAHRRFDREHRLRQSLDDPYRTLVSLHNRARASTLLGDLESALADYDSSLSLGARGSGTLTATWINRGRLMLRLGRLDAAHRDLDCALALAGNQARSTRAAASTGLGLVALERGDLERAEDYLDAARRLEHRATERARRDLDLATVYERLGRLDEAEAALWRAETAFRQQGRSLDWAAAGHRLGRLAKRRDRPSEAEDWLHRSLAVYQEHAPLWPRERAELDDQIAALCRRRGDLKSAVRHLARAAEAIEIFRSRRADESLRFAITKDAAAMHRERAAVLLELHRRHAGRDYARRALAASERARSRGLLDRLADFVTPRGARARALAAEVHELSTAILDHHVERTRLIGYRQAAARAAVESIDREIQQWVARHEQLAPQLAEAHAAYAELVLTSPLDLDALQAEIDPSTRLLVYDRVDDRMVAWVVSSASVEWVDLGMAEALESLIAQVDEALSVPPARASRNARLWLVDQLATAVVEPLAPLLGDAERLAIVASGAMDRVPFAALPWPTDGGRPAGVESISYSDRPWRDRTTLVDRFEIVHYPSAAAFVWLARRQPTASSGPVLVVADPTYGHADPRCPDPIGAPPPLDRLEASRVEAAAILDRLPVDDQLFLDGFEATRSRVVDALPSARIAHFAVHALPSAGDDGLPVLVFAQRDPDCRPIDGRLGTTEVHTLELDADLVVLSGCATAAGTPVDGEGLIGLVRGFLYAGAQRVVASHWLVDDRATAELMSGLYAALLAGDEAEDPAAALRSAQRELKTRKDFEEPFYWAGFTLNGSP